MVGGDLLGFLCGGGDESAPGKVVGSPQEAAGTLMGGGNGGIGKKGMGDAGNLQVVVQIKLHIVSVDSLQMAAGNDSGSQRQGSSVEEKIGQVVLSCQDDENADKSAAALYQGRQQSPDQDSRPWTLKLQQDECKTFRCPQRFNALRHQVHPKKQNTKSDNSKAYASQFWLF